MQPRIQSKANLTDFGSGFYLPSPARNKAESLSMFYFLLHIAVLGCLFHVCCRFLKSSLFVSLELRVFFLFFSFTISFRVSQRASFQPAILPTSPCSESTYLIPCWALRYMLLLTNGFWLSGWLTCVSRACLSSLVVVYVLVCLCSPLYASSATSALLCGHCFWVSWDSLPSLPFGAIPTLPCCVYSWKPHCPLQGMQP